MSKRKVIVCDHIHTAGLDMLSNDSAIEMYNGSDLPKEELLKVVGEYDVAITRSSTDVNKKFISSATNIKAIVRAGVGVDNVDIDGCSKEGIVVMNVPTANTIAAVELTMTHMLSNMRMFPNAHNNLKSDRVWKREKWYGHELKGKKLGVIGFGNIGSRVATRSKAFEMEVIAYDPYIPASKAIALGVEYTKNFDDILACDIITIHTPKNSETVNMIDKKEIAKMRDGVVLINCARGGLYNEEALYSGLKSGKIRFAGIDVFTKEPAVDHPLLELENITVTPHLGANTYESQYNIGVQAAQQAIEAAKGISYPNAMNLPIRENEMPKNIKPYFELVQKMAFMAAQYNKGPIVSIEVKAEGEIAGYLESLKTFAAVGALSESVGSKINYVNAEFISEERDVNLTTTIMKNISGFKNRVGVKLTTQSDTMEIYGTLFNEDSLRVIEINNFMLEIEPKGKMILFKNSDVPGVIGEVGMMLAKHNINVADFRLGRDSEHNNALAVIVVDSAIKSDVLEELAGLKAAIDVSYVEI